MAEHDNLGAALTEPSTATALRVDFSEGHALTEDVGKLTELTELHLRECPPDLVLPRALRDLPKLKTLSMTGENDDLVLPALVAELDLDHLAVWECDVKQLAPLSRLRSLFVVVRDPKSEVTTLAQLLPQLVKLDVWGGHLKAGELPADIERFERLEELGLVSCGLRDLPAELGHLVELFHLCLAGIPMTAIPDVVCELPKLRALDIGMHVSGLPAGLPKLAGTLRELRLCGALNQGAMLGRFDEGQIGRMKPLPRVLSQMTDLRMLNLECCGVVATDGLLPLKKLESLAISWAAMPTCEDIATLTALETLTLKHCSAITDFSPLAALDRLRSLDISNTQPASLAFLTSLASLKTLDVSSIECKDMGALYTPGLDLETLEASDEVLERWNKRSDMATPPDVAAIKTGLVSEDVAAVQAALLDLGRYVELASSGDDNALSDVFDVTPDETEIAAIADLDAALERYRAELSSDALAAVVAAGLRRVGDNFRATLLAIEEILRRKDGAAEQRVVQSFIAACEDYDAGHRYDEGTVHDQLIDAFFPQFEAGPLAELLAWCRNDHLNEDGGDRMAALFAPAFARTEDDATLRRLLARLAKYVKDQLGYGHGEAVDALLLGIDAAMPTARRAAFDEFRGRLDSELATLRLRARIADDAKSRDPGRVRGALDAATTLSDEDWKEVRHELWYCANAALPFELHRALLDLFVARADVHGVAETLGALARANLERLRGEIEEGLLRAMGREALAKHLREVLVGRFRPRQPRGLPVDALCAWAEELDGVSQADWRPTEVIAMFKAAFQHHDPELLGEAVAVLAEVPQGIDLTEPDKSYGGTIGDRLADVVGQMVTYADAPMLALARQFHRIALKDATRERILAQLVGLSAARDDHDAFAALSKLLPPEIRHPVLAYNLACAAARRGDRPAVVEHTRRALALGKSPTQFRDDSDFAPYLDDAELAALLDAAL